MTNQRIKDAARVTESTKVRIRNAIHALERKLSVNSLGVYMEPRDLEDWISLACSELEKARQEIRAAKWPTDADYDQV